MKNIREFVTINFDDERFFKDKKLAYLFETPNFIYENGRKTEKSEGIKVELVIIEDNTEYQKDGTNDFEKIVVKLPTVKNTNLKKGTVVKIIEPSVKVYGDYLSNISITAKTLGVIRDEQH